MAVPTSDELLELAFTKAQSPKSSASGDKSVTEHGISELLDAAFKLQDRTTTAGSLGSRGLRFSKLIPPGGGGD